MKFADQPEVRVDTVIAADPDSVWEVIADINLPARHSPESLGAEWLGGVTSPSVGARFEGTNEHPFMGVWSTTCTVTTCEPGRSFGWVVNDPDNAGAFWTFTLEPQGESTQVTFEARFGPGPSGLAIAVLQDPDREERIIGARMRQWRDNMMLTLAGVKAEVEA